MIFVSINLLRNSSLILDEKKGKDFRLFYLSIPIRFRVLNEKKILDRSLGKVVIRILIGQPLLQSEDSLVLKIFVKTEMFQTLSHSKHLDIFISYQGVTVMGFKFLGSNKNVKIRSFWAFALDTQSDSLFSLYFIKDCLITKVALHRTLSIYFLVFRFFFINFNI